MSSKASFRCTVCDHRFECEVIDREEAIRRCVSTSPVRCPRCGSHAVEHRTLKTSCAVKVDLPGLRAKAG